MKAIGIMALVLAGTAARADVDLKAKRIDLKLVYFGPGPLDDNLRYLAAKTDPGRKDKKGESFVPLRLSLGAIRGFKVDVMLYTVPHAAGLTESRKRILDGADGVVFVAGADPKVAKAWLDELSASLAGAKPPPQLVFQIVGAATPAALEAVKRALAVGDRQVFEAKPATGAGVFDTVKAVSKLMFQEVRKRTAPK